MLSVVGLIIAGRSPGTWWAPAVCSLISAVITLFWIRVPRQQQISVTPAAIAAAE